MLKKVPHTYVIIFFVIVFASVLTWFVPGGAYNKELKLVNNQQREVIVDNSFHHIDNEPQTWQIFSALFKGFVERSDIIVFIFIVGGAFMIVAKTKAIDIGIMRFLHIINGLKEISFFQKMDLNSVILILIMLLFSTFGAVFGMSEETIPFVMILIPLAISMGYDSIVGVSMVFVAAGLGFAGAMLNPFTIGIAQGIAELPLFSGIEYRFFAWMVINIVGFTYLIVYARKIKKNPQKSVVYHDDEYWRKRSDVHLDLNKDMYIKNKVSWVMFVLISLASVYFSIQYSVSTLELGGTEFQIRILPWISGLFVVGGIFALRKSTHFFVLLLLTFTVLYLIVGVLGYQWYIIEIASLFFALGIVSGIVSGYSGDTIVAYFLEGVKDIASAALVVGLAGGIIVILEDGQIIDSLLYAVSGSISDTGQVASVSLMYVFQTVINLFIPSGSGQAALTMPLMAPLSDLLNVPRQSAVLAFQFGDGFTNMITPTSGVLIAVLGVAKIPYEKWFSWVWPFILLMAIVALMLLIPTVLFEFNGF